MSPRTLHANRGPCRTGETSWRSFFFSILPACSLLRNWWVWSWLFRANTALKAFKPEKEFPLQYQLSGPGSLVFLQSPNWKRFQSFWIESDITCQRQRTRCEECGSGLRSASHELCGLRSPQHPPTSVTQGLMCYEKSELSNRKGKGRHEAFCEFPSH